MQRSGLVILKNQDKQIIQARTRIHFSSDYNGLNHRGTI